MHVRLEGVGFLMGQFGDAGIIGDWVPDCFEHGTKGVPVVEADITALVRGIIEFEAEAAGHGHEGLVMKRFRVGNNAVEVEDDGSDQGVFSLRWRGRCMPIVWLGPRPSADDRVADRMGGFGGKIGWVYCRSNPPMKLPSYDDALKACLPQIEPLPAETVGLEDAAGRVLRRELIADRDQPPFDRATMDGFAVVGGSNLQAPASWPIGATLAAGAANASGFPVLAPGSVARIATGAPMIHGVDAVVPIEQTRAAGDDAVAFDIDRVEPGCNVHPRGSDARAGDTVLASGTRLAPHHVAIAATVGATRLEVSRRPVVSILTSGDEVVPPSTSAEHLGSAQIRNSNGPLVRALLARLGVEVGSVEHVRDDRDATLQMASHCVAISDLVVSTGGVSVGHRDWLAWAWDELGVERLVRGAAIQPGKPILVGRSAGHRAAWVVGLPGNPVSVAVTAHLFLWPILLRMLAARAPLPWHSVALASPVQSSASRQLFRAVNRGEDGRAQPVPWHGSGDLMHLGTANGIIRLPCADRLIEAGEALPFLPLVA